MAFRSVHNGQSLRPRYRLHTRLLALGLTGSVALSLFTGAPAVAAPPDDAKAPATQQDKAAKGRNAKGKAVRAGTTGRPFKVAAPAWPAPGAAEVDVPAAAANRSAAAAKPALTRAGALPVSVGPAADAPATAADAPARAAAATGPVRVRVQLLDRAAARASGVDGVLLRVERKDAESPAAVRLAVDYTKFRYAYGADWASRLRLVALPDCALTTPEDAGCQATPLASTNDRAAGVVSANIEASRAATVLAVTAGPAGPTGDFSATPLQASSTWEAGGNSGGFSWEYPLRVPPSTGGPTPDLELSYSSQSVDGRVSAANNQPTWAGEGMDLSTPFIERRYRSCAKDMGSGASNTTKSGDLCWTTDNATLSMDGRSTELVFKSGEIWVGRTDDGSRIERKTGGVNGDNNGEYWVVTTADGTQYWFGRNRLPGWKTGAPETGSVGTVPVFGNHANEPCRQSSFATSWCQQAWRWNLDWVVDPRGNAMSYWYGKETNKYARNNSATTLAEYVRDGYVSRIDYGLRADDGYAAAPMRVDVSVADRCLSDCAKKDAAHWPDTPFNEECTKSPCLIGSPTFWSTKRLSKVTTQLWTGSATNYRDVESWTFTHGFPDAGDGMRAGLWLEKITHTAPGLTKPVGDVSFTGVQMPNRVDAVDHSAAMNWWRISYITTETGGRIAVSYSKPECVAGATMPAAAETNTMRCFPVRWTPEGHSSPVTDWFHKYVVTKVVESDLGLPQKVRAKDSVTEYRYPDPPAWHYTDDDGLISAEDKTWSVWRGYDKVLTTTGEGGERTGTVTRYFRGMHGDKLPSGSRSVTLPAAGEAPAVNDEDAYAGMARESITLNGPDGAEVSGEVSEPWQSEPVAARTINGTTVHARKVNVTATYSREALDGGRGARGTVVRTTFDPFGMPTRIDDRGVAPAGDESCTLISYGERNTTAWLVSLTHRVRKFATDCATAEGGALTEDDVIDDDLTYYDGATKHGTAPTRGLATRIDELKSWKDGKPGYVTASTATHDSRGRVETEQDVKQHTTRTSYTHTAGGQLESTTETNHLGWTTTTTVDPAWGETTSTVEPDGQRTDQTYDVLGRLTAVWLPGRSRQANQTASLTFDYDLRSEGPSTVTTRTLNAAGGYVASYALLDSLLRPRQSQAPEAGTQGGRVVTDTWYDTAGRAYKTWGPYVGEGAPTGAALYEPEGEQVVPKVDRTVFDGAGRVSASIFTSLGVEKWRTTTTYGGDHTDVTPPQGGTATSTVTDARDNVVALRQYTGGTPSGDHDTTTYEYDRKGRSARVLDAVGNEWRYGYDLRDRVTSRTDPDTGTTTSTYNDAGELTSITDARGASLFYLYDSLGRKTELREESPTGKLRAQWRYDTLSSGESVKGQQVGSTRFVDGAAYINEVTGFNTAGQPTGSKFTIPARETGLSGVYTYVDDYKENGAPNSSELPAIGGLPTEKLEFGYNGLGLPTTVRTNRSATGASVPLVNGTSYTRYGEVAVYGLRYDAGRSVSVGHYYEDGSRRLSRVLATRTTAPSTIADTRYTYDPAGNTEGISEQVSADHQCFGYDHLRRLTEAWTARTDDCATAPSASSLGGPAPYWHSWTFDKVGNRRTQTEHATPAGKRTTTYAYPAAKAAQPHTTTGITVEDNGGKRDGAYTYDKAGNTLTRPNGPAGAQTLTWDPEGRLETSTDSGGTTRYIYDADGERLITQDPKGKTLYLDEQELRWDADTRTATGTRYYTHAGSTVASRTPAGLTWLIADHHGTATHSVVDDTNQAATTRRQDPYGGARGAAVGWPNNRGFVGGQLEGTGLIHLGAREYDAGLGRFISADPIANLADPQQLNGYAYANNTPTTQSDPDGLLSCGWCKDLVKKAKKIYQAGKRKVVGAARKLVGFGKKLGKFFINLGKKIFKGIGRALKSVAKRAFSARDRLVAAARRGAKRLGDAFRKSLKPQQRVVVDWIGRRAKSLDKWSKKTQADVIGVVVEGLVVGTGGYCETVHGLRSCKQGRLPLHAKGGTMLGNRFVTDRWPSQVTEGLATHEKYHRDHQWEKYGAWFGPMYLSATIEDNLIDGKKCNRYEHSAEVASHGGGGYGCL